MLTAEEKQEIEKAIEQVPVKKAACVEALKSVKEHRRWISDESLKEVAAFMEMSAEELDSVATFYNLIFRKPVGRHVILLCDSISCWVMGYENIRAQLTKRLNINYGETSADGRFTFLRNPCLVMGDFAPALMIDSDLFRNIKVEQFDDIFRKYE